MHQQQHWSTTSEQQQQLSSSNTKEPASSAAYKPPTFLPTMTPYVNGTNSNHYHHHHHHHPQQHPNPLSGNSGNLGIRPPPPSPQTPTQAAAAAAAAVAGHGFNHSPHYSPYSMFPPSLYSYYSSQQPQQQQQPSQAFSPNTNQQQQQQLSSPSPISPFLVPNLPLSSSSQASSPGLVVSSSMISNGGLLSNNNSSSFSFQESGSVHEQQKTSSRRGSRSSPLMDLTVDRTKMGGRSGGGQESPVDCSKQQHQQQNCDLSAKASEGASTLESAILSGGVKRKGPSEEHSTPSRQSLSATSESSERTSAMNDHQSSGGSASRKHRLSKPPNINISDCGSSSGGNPYRNGFPPPTSPFPLHSPLFAHSPHPFGGTGGSGHLVPTSPFAAHHPAYSHPHHFPHHLEHSIPLSAPPMAAFSSHHHSHHQSSSSTPKFDFSVGAMTGQPSSASAAAEFTFPASRGHFSNTKENLPSSSSNTTSTATTSSSSSSAKLISSSQKEATIIPSSIMKDTSKSSNRKSSLGGCGGGNSECKVTFQVPHQSRGGNSSAITGESKSERGKGGDPASNRKTAINNNRKSAPASSQKHYPEYFRKGSTIRLGNGALKKVEELSSADFIDSVSASTMSSSSSAFGASGKFKVEQSEVLAIGERSNRRSPGTGNNLVRITFLVGSPAVAVSLESPLEHPFFVVAKGWSSCSPSSTLKRYGLQCQRLAKGDSVVTLASRTAPVSGGTPSKGENRGTSLLNSSPRSLASSSGSLSSSSSSSASSSSSTSTTASPLLNCPPPPPPAHHLGSLLSSSSSSAAAAAIRHHSNQHNLESSGVLNLDTKSGRHKLSRSNSQQQEEDEEIDVENVDEQQQS